MLSKNISNIFKISLGVLVVVLVGYYFYLYTLPKTAQYTPKNSEQNFVEEKFEDSPVVDGYKSYANSTAGFSFEYPEDWKLQLRVDDYSVDDFYAFLLPPSWGQASSPEIWISKKYSGKAGDNPMMLNSYDNKEITEQMKAFDDCKKMNLCELATNKNGVKYFRYPKLMQCDENEGCIFWSSFPTGKYIINFNMVVHVSPKTLPKFQTFVDTYNKMADSVKLE